MALEEDRKDFGLLGLSRVRVCGFGGLALPMYHSLEVNGGVRQPLLGMLGWHLPVPTVDSLLVMGTIRS